MKRLLLSAAVLAATLLVVAVASVLYQQRYDRRHLRIMDDAALGSSREHLEATAGSPSYITDGSGWAAPGAEQSESERVNGCVMVYWYRSRVLFLPSRYAYCFDSGDHLIRKFHWFSW